MKKVLARFPPASHPAPNRTAPTQEKEANTLRLEEPQISTRQPDQDDLPIVAASTSDDDLAVSLDGDIVSGVAPGVVDLDGRPPGLSEVLIKSTVSPETRHGDAIAPILTGATHDDDLAGLRDRQPVDGDHLGIAELLWLDVGPQYTTRVMLLRLSSALSIRPHPALPLPLDGWDRRVGCGSAFCGRALMRAQLLGLHLVRASFCGHHHHRLLGLHWRFKTLQVKYKKYSPAMLEGFTDRRLILEELLMWRVPE